MNTIFYHIITSILLLFGSFQCRAEELDKDMKSSPGDNSARLLKTAAMVEPLNRSLNAVEIAKRGIAEFQEEVKTGKIKIDYRWCAYSDEKDKKMIRLAKYDSQNGPVMAFFSKRVYSDSAHSNEVHTLGYDIYFYTNGQMRAYMRRDWAESFQYFENGQIRIFQVNKLDGVYNATWDTNGCLLQERTSNGLIEKK